MDRRTPRAVRAPRLKAFLEYGVRFDLVRDRYPKGIDSSH